MSGGGLRLVFLGLSLSSSWGNGHATTYRALLKALAARGHDILFLERDQPWYSAERDLTRPRYCRLQLYRSPAELVRWADEIVAADAVVLGSYVPNGIEVARFLQACAQGTTVFYDIDTPVTLAQLDGGRHEYLTPALIRGFDLYLSFTGGPILRRIEREFDAAAARALYCSVDPQLYRPVAARQRWDLGYLGTYSADRQPKLEMLLLESARRAPQRRFVVAGAQYPDGIDWPRNVDRIEHLPPARHAEFYSSLGWTLNVTRAAMVAVGYSPSVRLFEAAACATPIISDFWAGLDDLLHVGREVMIAETAEDVAALLAWPPSRRRALGEAAQRRVLATHTAAHRAAELERHLRDAHERRTGAGIPRRVGAAARPPSAAISSAPGKLPREGPFARLRRSPSPAAME
jgi:spore maturation protein CgeB